MGRVRAVKPCASRTALRLGGLTARPAQARGLSRAMEDPATRFGPTLSDGSRPDFHKLSNPRTTHPGHVPPDAADHDDAHDDPYPRNAADRCIRSRLSQSWRGGCQKIADQSDDSLRHRPLLSLGLRLVTQSASRRKHAPAMSCSQCSASHQGRATLETETPSRSRSN